MNQQDSEKHPESVCQHRDHHHHHNHRCHHHHHHCQRIYKTENSLKVMWNRARLQDIHQYDKIQVHQYDKIQVHQYDKIHQYHKIQDPGPASNDGDADYPVRTG